MPDIPQPTAVAVVAPVAAAPRPWMQFVLMVAAVVTLTLTMTGVLMTIGAWRNSVDLQIADLKKRMDRAEDNQKTYIPVLLGLTKDVSYLADRARREDDRLDRERRAN